MKYCEDCKHFRPNRRHLAGFWRKRLTEDAVKYAKCARVPDVGGDVFVSPKLDGMYCSIARNEERLCGPGAKLYEPIEGRAERMRAEART